jgi:hypothetical protein
MSRAQTTETGRKSRPDGAPGRGRAFASLAAALLMLTAATCLAGPPRRGREASPAPPPAPDVDPGTVAVDLNRSKETTTFRRNLTPAQRIHTHLDLGKVFESSGNYDAALMEYQQGLAACEKKSFGRSQSADEALAHRRIGNVLDRLGRFAQSELHYKKAIKCNPKDPKIWNDAGYSYYLQGRWADAERTLKTALGLAPEEPRIQTNLGLTLAAAGRTQEALPILSRFSGDAIGHANLGYLLAATGQTELARQQYLQALALRPNLVLARRALAKLDLGEQAATVASSTTVPPPAPPRTVSAARPRPGDQAVVRAAAAAPAAPKAPGRPILPSTLPPLPTGR